MKRLARAAETVDRALAIARSPRLPGRLDGRLGLPDADLLHCVVQDDEQVPLPDEVVGIDADLAHVLGDPGRHMGDVGVDVGVVGRDRVQGQHGPRIEVIATRRPRRAATSTSRTRRRSQPPLADRRGGAGWLGSVLAGFGSVS